MPRTWRHFDPASRSYARRARPRCRDRPRRDRQRPRRTYRRHPPRRAGPPAHRLHRRQPARCTAALRLRGYRAALSAAGRPVVPSSWRMPRSTAAVTARRRCAPCWRCPTAGRRVLLQRPARRRGAAGRRRAGRRVPADLRRRLRRQRGGRVHHPDADDHRPGQGRDRRAGRRSIATDRRRRRDAATAEGVEIVTLFRLEVRESTSGVRSVGRRPER